MKIKTIILMILIGLCSCHRYFYYVHTAGDQKYESELLQNDFGYLWRSLNEIHPNLYLFIEQEALLEKYEQTKTNLSDSMSWNAFFLTVSEFLASIRDGHTYPLYNIDTTKTNYFPFDLAFQDDAVYIVQDYSTDDSDILGYQLLEINNLPIEQLMTQMFDVLYGETVSFKKRSIESDNFKSYYHVMYPEPLSFQMTLRSSEGEQKEMTFSGLKISEIRKIRYEIFTDNYRLTFTNHDSIAVMDINSFSDKKLKSFYKDSFEEINRRGVSNLIIDLRDNLGGESDNIDDLLSYLMDEPFMSTPQMQIKVSDQFKKESKKRIPLFFRWLPLQYLDKRGRMIWEAEVGEVVTIQGEKFYNPKDEEKRFNSNVIVLLNGYSVSATSIFATIFQENKLGIVAGTESGTYEGGCYGEHFMIELPNTRINVLISMMFFKHSEFDQVSNHGVLPDIFIEQEIEDRINNIDTQLEAAKLIFRDF